MGNHVGEAVEGLPTAKTIKVHAKMCSELSKLVSRVSEILPEIEAARPRCIDALCSLNSGIDKAKTVLEQCSESSILYLALTGDAILSRCKKSRNLLEQSLVQIQSMVPVKLDAKISGIVADLRGATFHLDPSEEEAGRMLRKLLHKYGSTVDSTEEAALAAICTVASRLYISSKKALLIEKRSIKRLLQDLDAKDKRKILLFFQNLLNKYGKIIAKEQMDNGSPEHKDPSPFPSPYHSSTTGVPLPADYRSNEAQIDSLSKPVPPEEFICPLSSRLMYDPVVIASGQTYERMWIQKWFDEGHVTCPKTNEKLANLSFTSNTSMKALIRKWCAVHSVSIPDPKVQEELLLRSLETSTNSIASLTNSMIDLNLPMDYSNTSFGSSHGSDLSGAKMSNVVEHSHDIDTAFLSKFSTLEDVKRLLKHNDETWSDIPSGKFIQVILQFLKDAHERHDMEAQMTGCLLLFEFMQKHSSPFWYHRISASYMKEEEYVPLASLLDTEVSKQALSILEILSSYPACGCKIAASGALIGILNILDSQIPELLELALKILANLSSNTDVIPSFIIPSELIPKLVPILDDESLARHCITILKNLHDNADARMCFAETDGCIGSIAKLLETENREDQEVAVSILLSLCSQRVEFCDLVMDEGVIPGLNSVFNNGSKRAQGMAVELLRILKNEVAAGRDDPGSPVVTVETTKQCDDLNPPKAGGFLSKMKMFSKQSGKKKK